MAKKADFELPRAKFPEEVGVDSKEIKALIEDFEANEDEVHSIQIVRHGKVAYERWRYPYAPEIPHTMYSVARHQGSRPFPRIPPENAGRKP